MTCTEDHIEPQFGRKINRVNCYVETGSTHSAEAPGGGSQCKSVICGIRMNTESPGTDDSDTLGMLTVQENHLGGYCLSVPEMEA